MRRRQVLQPIRKHLGITPVPADNVDRQRRTCGRVWGQMSQAGWLSPKEPWPSHSRPLARSALSRARGSGWWLRKAGRSGHLWGILTCADPAIPPEGRCTFSVLSTSGPADGSATAKVIDQHLRNCEHERDHEPETVNRFEAVEVLLQRAAQALVTAEHLLAAKAHAELVEDFLRQAEAEVGEADELLARAVEADDTSSAEAALAATTAQSLGVSSSLGAQHFAEQADQEAGDARAKLSGESGQGALSLRQKCDEIRARARALLEDL